MRSHNVHYYTIRYKLKMLKGNARSLKLISSIPQKISLQNSYIKYRIIYSSTICHLPEETGVQLMCAASYDIWCRDLDTDQTSTEQTCGRTDQNGKNKEVCSTSHTKIEGPTSGLGRGLIDIIYTVRQMKWSWARAY